MQRLCWIVENYDLASITIIVNIIISMNHYHYDEDLVDITIIVNIFLEEAKDAQAKSPIFTNGRAEKLRKSENIHWEQIYYFDKNQLKEC